MHALGELLQSLRGAVCINTELSRSCSRLCLADKAGNLRLDGLQGLVGRGECIDPPVCSTLQGAYLLHQWGPVSGPPLTAPGHMLSTGAMLLREV